MKLVAALLVSASPALAGENCNDLSRRNSSECGAKFMYCERFAQAITTAASMCSVGTPRNIAASIAIRETMGSVPAAEAAEVVRSIYAAPDECKQAAAEFHRAPARTLEKLRSSCMAGPAVGF